MKNRVFGLKLSAALKKSGMTATELAAETGICNASISQYLSGQYVPRPAKQRALCEALGLPQDYFADEEVKAVKSNKIPRLTVTETARIMGMAQQTVANGLQEGVFPWGYAIRNGRGWTYFINARHFAEVERVDLDEVMEKVEGSEKADVLRMSAVRG